MPGTSNREARASLAGKQTPTPPRIMQGDRPLTAAARTAHSQEIAAVTPWLTYGPPLHFAREFGCKNKLFDLLDETKLLPSQAKELAELILGCGPLPEPELSFPDFLNALKGAQARVPAVFHPLKMAPLPWFDATSFGKAAGGRRGSCIIA